MYFEYKDYVGKSDTYKEMLQAMKEETDYFIKHYNDDTRYLSGWGHGYFCNEDGGRLIYDMEKPFEHRCSICGKVYKEFKYDTYFITMYRNEAVVTAIKAAILYRIHEDETYLNIVKQIIGFYADHYEHFPVHAKEQLNCKPDIDVGGAGKIMPQGLNEAIVAIRFISAMEIVKESLEAEWIEDIKEKLFAPIFELLLPQKMHIHNIPTWIDSCMGVMGLFFHQEEWMKEAISNPYHIYEQIRTGVTKSGFWYEGSIHYNFFALEGIMTFLVFAETYHLEVPEDVKETIFGMLDAAYHYAFDNDIFPNPSDGWPNISLQTYSYVYYMGYKVFGKKVAPYLKHIEENCLERGRLPLSEPYYFKNSIPLERLLFAPDIMEIPCEETKKRTSASFEASNCAILRCEPFNVFLKYGHQTISHAHPDKMNVEIMVNNHVLTKDLSNSGYASKMCKEWHRKIAAHNTCVVDGKETDLSRAGKLLEYKSNKIKAETEAYDDVTYTREIEVKGTCLEDCFYVQGEKEGTIDWFFHFETPIQQDNLTTKEVTLFEEYGLMKESKEIVTDCKEVVIEHELVTMKLMLEDGMKVYLCKTYNNPADKMRDTIIIRKTGNHAKFHSILEAKSM